MRRMKKIFITIIMTIIPLIVLWVIFYICHYLKVTDLSSVWWGFPYMITSFVAIIGATALCALGIANLWES